MNLLIGPANSGKTEYLLSRLAEALEAGRGGVRLISPSSRSGEILFDRLKATMSSGGAGKPEQTVTSFPGLYVSLLGQVREGVSWITPDERGRLIGRITARLSAEGRLEYFGGTAECPGLAVAVSRFIDELWRAGVGPEEFAAIAEGRAAKDRDLALIFARYQEALSSSGRLDPEGAGLAAVRLLEGKTATGHLVSREARERIAGGYSLLAADDFDFYSPVQVRLLSLLSAHGAEVYATLSYREGSSVHLWQEPTRRRFEAAGFNLIRFDSKPENAIQLAAARLLCDEADGDSDGQRESMKAAPEISVVSAPDRVSEVRAVAREVKKLSLACGVALDEITVVCRSLAAYSQHLERVFDECGIPLRIDCAQALAGNQLALAVMRLLDLAPGGFPRRAAVETLRSPYFDLSYVGLDPFHAELIDAVSLDENVTRGKEQWMSALFSAGAGREGRTVEADSYPGQEETAEERLERYGGMAVALSNLFQLITPPATGSRRERSAFVANLLGIFKVKERAEGSPFAERDAGALKAFEAVLRDVSTDGPEPRPEGEPGATRQAEVSWAQFYAELERAFNDSTFERPQVSRRAVVAQEAHNLHPRPYRALFVLGLAEGEFPAKSSESAPYTRGERGELPEAGIDLTESTNDAGADLLQFYKAMSRCRERLYLTCARTDSAGGELLKSYLIDEIISSGPAREIRLQQALQDAGGARQAEAASLDELALISARSLRPFVTSGRAEGASHAPTRSRAQDFLRRKMPEWNAAVRAASIEADRILFRGSAAHRGAISDGALRSVLKRRLGKNHLWSATQINDYGVCPYRFFACHLLRLAPVNEPVEGFVSNRLGSAYHEILERFYSEGGTVDECERLAGRITEEVIGRMLEAGEIRSSPFLDFEKDFIKRQVARLIQAEDRWRESNPARPSAFELDFGREETPPLIIESDDEEIRVCGTIDRIDESEEGCVVIDYKTRRTPVRYDDALDGRDLQLPIYILAASRVLRPGREVRSAYYLHINSRKKGSEFPHAGDERLSLKSIMERAENLIREYTSRARAGEFPIAPNNNRCAPHCGFHLMCRIQSVGSEES